ncbi:MAG: lytic transglycosylase domain-containing protein [Myxococcales bacterium]|nr:lytic transglycosylase domain-containing protein [Myxococcales bacterium]
MRRVLPVLLVALMATPAAADIYECRGADGSVEFTNLSRGRNCRLVVRESDTRRRQAGAAQPQRRSGTMLPDRFRRYDAYIREAATLYQLPEAFIRAVIKVESDYVHDVVSHAGAMGLMQLMPRTAASMGVRDPFDPRQSILGGARYLRILANLFDGDLVLTIAAYNAGEGAVMRHRGIPPYAETQRYVRRVLGHYHAFLQGASGTQPR